MKSFIVVILTTLILGGSFFLYNYFSTHETLTNAEEESSIHAMVLEELIASPTAITAKPGDIVELVIKGTFWDELTAEKHEINLLDDEQFKKKLIISVEDENVAHIEVMKMEGTASDAESHTSNPDLVASDKKGSLYKAIVKIPEDPAAVGTTIVIDYDGKFKKEIPITLKGLHTEMSQEEASKLMNKLLHGIFSTYHQLGSQYNWSNISNPPDLNIIEPELMKYATEKFTKGDLRKVTEAFYCQCDDFFSTNVDFDVRTTIHENSMNLLTVSTPDFATVYSPGSTGYFTAVKENGQWKLDKWEFVTSDIESMDVTWEEYNHYIANLNGGISNIELINELTTNGRKVYVYKDRNELYAIYADNTEIEYEEAIPSEWLPAEYQQQKSADWNGIWTSTGGMTGTLDVTNLTEDEFEFSIYLVSSTSHVAELEGKAVVSENSAKYSDEYGCTVDFNKNGTSIQVTESMGCLAWHGAGASFDTTFNRE